MSLRDLKVLVPLWAALTCLGCASAEWHTRLSPNAMEEWRENGSYYALREIVDTRLYLWQAPWSYVPTSDDCVALLGEPYTTEFPGRLGNLLVYRSRRKTWEIVDTVLTFGTNELITNLEWLDPSPHPWGAIELPHAECGPVSHFSVMGVDLGLDEYGRVFRGYTLMSTNTLSHYLVARHKKYGEFPVMIGADETLTFKDVWPLVRIAREAGLWRINYAVYGDKAGRHISCLDFSAPVRPGTAAKGPVILAEPYGKEVLKVRVLKDGFVLQENGKVIDVVELGRQLARLARMSSDVTVLGVPEDDTTHGQVVQLLDLCQKSQLSNVSIMSSEEFEMKSEGSE